MASSVSATNSRLSVDDWVQEGFRVLAEDGVKGFSGSHAAAVTSDGLAQCLGKQKTVARFGPEVGIDRVTGQSALQ